jgi:hypothetical protein
VTFAISIAVVLGVVVLFVAACALTDHVIERDL